MQRKIWNIEELTPQAVHLGRKYNLSAYLIQIFINRNIPESDFNSFLNPALVNLHSPFLLPDIEKASNRIKEAVARKEKILIVGDYDVDGLTSLAIFHEFIKDFPGIFSFYIPHRAKEGYGINQEVINKAKTEERSLIIAFDCGTNSLPEIETAQAYGIDVIVIDHHLPKDGLNYPFAFINPKRKDSKYPFYDLSAGALSFKLLQVLKGTSCWEVLDLAALSVVCDVVPLKGENRIILHEGIRCLRETKRSAIKALCKVGGLKQENIDTFHIGFILGPRINASGRVAHAQDALEIFTSDDQERIYSIAKKLGEYNRLRKDIETQILKEAEQMLEKEPIDSHAIVVSGDGWHPGVLGIVASRLTEKYYRPSFVISFDEGVGKGSGRSIHSVHLVEMLDKCAKYLHSYGGHRKAAGIQIFKEAVSSFKEKLDAVIKENLSPQDFIPILQIDAEINFQEITMGFIDDLDKLKPFGEENSKPLFLSRRIAKRGLPKKIPSGYSVWLNDEKNTFEGIVYNKDLLQILEYGKSFDLVYSLEKNTFHNIPKLAIKDCRLTESKS